MGSIGDTFPYPNLVVGQTDWASKLVLILDETIDRLSSKVPFSAISADDLNLDGNKITNVSAIYFNNVITPLPNDPGLIQYNNGEWWLITTAGAIQITSGGHINVSTTGGIGGDYGTGPEQVRFVNAQARYDFWDDFAGGNYGRVRARSFDVNNGANGANFARINYGTAADITLTLPSSLPGANRSVLTVTSGGQIEPNDGTNTITNDVYLGNVEIKHTKQRSVNYICKVDSAPAGTFINSGAFDVSAVECTSDGDFYTRLDGLQVGWRIKAVKVRCNRNLADPADFKIYKLVDNVAPATIGVTNDVGTGALATVTVTVGAPAAIVATERYVVGVEDAATNDIFYSIEVVYDIP